MLGLLARVVIGVAIGGAVAGTAIAIYKCVTKDIIRGEVEERCKENGFHDILKAEVKKRSEDGQTVNVDVMDEWDNPVTNMDVTGDEISDDIHVGDIILINS